MKLAGVVFSLLGIALLTYVVWANLAQGLAMLPTAIAFVAGAVVVGCGRFMALD